MPQLTRRKPDVHPKGWGEELWLYNGDYCMKLLRFRQDSKCSMHFHRQKHETWYVVSGSFSLASINVKTGELTKTIYHAGGYVTIEPGLPHQVFAITDVEIVEASTHHEESDSYRIAPGDSQTKST